MRLLAFHKTSRVRIGTAPGRSAAGNASAVRARLARGVALAWPLLPALLFLPVVLAPPINHDVAAVLQFSQRWLAGERLYSDLIDVNPPLIYVLNLIPAAIAATLRIDAVMALQGCLLVFGLVCWRLAWIARDRAAEGAVERALLDALPPLFLLGAGYDFGQREHLMAVAALPYLVGAARRAGGGRPRGMITAAALAGIGFALKPHFLGIPFMAELVVLVMRRPTGPQAWARAVRLSLRDPVPRTLAVVWASYLLSLPLLFADYVTVVVPLVWSLYLDLGGLSVWQLLLVPRLACAICLLVPCVYLAFRHSPWRASGPTAALPRLLGAAGIGALASAIVQHKGWTYHILPIEMFAGALATTQSARWLDRLAAGAALPRPATVAAAFTGLIALYGICNGEAPWREITYSDGEVAELTSLLKRTAGGAPVLFLSPGVYPIFPAMNYAGTRLTLRTMNMWMLEGAYDECLPDGRRYRGVWEMSSGEFFVFRTVAEDFAKAPPAAVVVDKETGIPSCGEPFDFIEYFERNPLFAEQWSHYRLTAEWDRYKVYTRTD
jgi:hypothetical protein